MEYSMKYVLNFVHDTDVSQILRKCDQMLQG